MSRGICAIAQARTRDRDLSSPMSARALGQTDPASVRAGALTSLGPNNSQRGQAYLGTVLLIVGRFIIPLSQPPHKPLRWLYRQCVHIALEPDLATRGSGGQHFASCCRFASAITPVTARID